MNFIKKTGFLILIIVFVANLSATKYAGEIFRMGAGVRNFALGNIGVSDPNSFGLAYWNSAYLYETTENKFELMHAEEYAGLLKYDTASAIWGKNSKFSLVITRIGIDDIPLTKLNDPNSVISGSNRPYKYKSVNNSDLVIYFGMARKFGKYVLGFTPKIAYRNLAEESGFGFGADISTYFKFKNFNFGLKLRDFFSTQILWTNGTHEIVTPGLDLEANYGFTLPVILRKSRLFLGLENHLEGRDTAAAMAVGPASFDYHLGWEINMHRAVDLYLGYDIEHFTSGLSLNIKSWLINYAFEQNSDLESSHRISIGYKM